MTSVNTEENTFAQKTITTQEEIKLSENIYQSSASNSEENVATLDNVEVYKQEPNFKSKAEKLRFTVVIIGVILAMFMMSLNSTVVAPALSIIATDLNALSSQTWIATAYLVAVNSFQPLSGKVKKKKETVIFIYTKWPNTDLLFYFSFLIFLEGSI